MFNLNFKKLIKKSLASLHDEKIDKKLILEAKSLSLKNNKMNRIENLSKVEFQVFSQWGEDGIIEWLINKIKFLPKNFIEIGTEDYKECNTRFLLINHYWDGFLIEGDKIAVEKIKKDRVFWKHNLKIFNSYLNLDNYEAAFKKLKIPKKIGIISLDIDGIDYWILKKLKSLKPGIFICEFNPLFGYDRLLTVPYKKKFVRSKEHYSNLYFGASLKAITELLNKQYLFIGTNSAGNNAFFVNKKYSKYIKNKIINKKIFKSKFRESRNKMNKLNYLNKIESIKVIKQKKLFDIKKNKIIKIQQIFNEKK
tara:strand:- start:798 stop:1724 length:927 start_codon:yes stop_codon:yes gene_type:complete